MTICLTCRGSGIRVPYRPPEKALANFLMKLARAFFVAHPLMPAARIPVTPTLHPGVESGGFVRGTAPHSNPSIHDQTEGNVNRETGEKSNYNKRTRGYFQNERGLSA